MEDIKKITSLFCQMTHRSESDIFNVQNIGGMTNNNFLVTINTGEQFVFRKAGCFSNELVNRKNEYANSILVQELNLTPETIYFDVKNGYKITRYIENAKMLTPFSIGKYWQEICDVLYLLHISDMRFVNDFDWKQEFESYKEKLKKVGGKFVK